MEKTAEVLVEEVERLKTTETFKGLKNFVEKCAVLLNIAKIVEKCEILVESHLLQFQKAWNVFLNGPGARWRQTSTAKRRKMQN